MLINKNAAFVRRRFCKRRLSLEFFRLSREPFNPLGNWRMRGEKIPDARRRERLNDKKMRRGRRSDHRDSLGISIKFLQRARQCIRIVRDAGASGIGFIFARA